MKTRCSLATVAEWPLMLRHLSVTIKIKSDTCCKSSENDYDFGSVSFILKTDASCASISFMSILQKPESLGKRERFLPDWPVVHFLN